VRIVDHREVLAALAAGAQVVDVLPAREYRVAHLRGAVHLPLPRVMAGAGAALDPQRPCVVYCRDAL
jgi:rhodanese-related sulfurtransferase